MPGGLDVTAPPPLPDFETVSVGCANVAVTDLDTVVLTLHVVEPPLQLATPLHPTNTESASGLANRSAVFPLKNAEHVLPQLIPPGLEVTVPAPVPALDTVMVA